MHQTCDPLTWPNFCIILLQCFPMLLLQPLSVVVCFGGVKSSLQEDACSAVLRSGDQLGQSKIIHFSSLMKSFVCWQCLLGHCLAAWWSSLLLWVSSSIKISEPTPKAAMQAQAMTLPPPCFADKLVCFGSWAHPFLLHTFGLWWILVLSVP